VGDRRNVDDGFWDRADAYIHLANSQCEKVGAGKVSASLLYAASRFNAFIVGSQSSSSSEFRKRQQDALKYFTAEFRKML
jgi:hypothetical protein